MHDPLFHTARTTARIFTPHDASVGQHLVEQCGDFFELVGGERPGPEAFQKLYSQFPAGADPDDMSLAGFFDTAGHDLIGLAGWVRSYPTSPVWFLDLFLLAPEHRNAGLGREIYRAWERWAIAGGAQAIELTVAEQNVAAQRFWSRLGFIESSRAPAWFLSMKSVLITLRKRL